MNDHELDLALAAMGQQRTAVADLPELYELVRTTAATAPLHRGFPPPSTWRFQSMFSATKFIAAVVIVALFGGFLLNGVLMQQQGESMPGAATGEPGTFSPGGSLAEDRSGHTATLLPDGRVLVVGGVPGADDGSRPTLAEVWDPATASFSPAGSLAEGRVEHTATLLPDGRVLVIGGWDFWDLDHSAEVWDPTTASFGPAGSMAFGRSGHTATLLPDGRVLVVGDTYGQPVVEVWDPATESFALAGRLADDRQDGHTATLLADGRVLVVGGGKPGSPSAEVWDPATASFSPAGTLVTLHGSGRYDGQPVARSGHTATLLHDGRVLVVGGSLGPGGSGGSVGPSTAEVWDPATESFEPAGSLAQIRSGRIAPERRVSAATSSPLTAMLLPDGRVLVVGGDDNQPVSGEVWDPTTASFSPVAGSLTPARYGYTATLLPDGRVLVVGGDVGGEYALASAEVWDVVEG